jgi:hypothetical protein
MRRRALRAREQRRKRVTPAARRADLEDPARRIELDLSAIAQIDLLRDRPGQADSQTISPFLYAGHQSSVYTMSIHCFDAAANSALVDFAHTHKEMSRDVKSFPILLKVR